MKKLCLVLLIIIVASAIIFGGCAQPAPAPSPAPAPATAPATPPKPAIKVGLLYPLTGFMGLVGKEHLEGCKLAFERAGYQVAGRKIETVIGDSAYDASVAVDAARKMIEYDKVDMIVGTIGGHENLAVGDYMTKVGMPLLIAKPAPWPTVMQKWVFLGGGVEQQYSSAMGLYAYEKLGYRTINILTVDAVHAHGFAYAFKAPFESKGGKTIQEQYVPDPTYDFAPYLAGLKDADVLVAWFSGEVAIRFYSQLQEFGIRKKWPHIVALFFGSHFDPTTIRELPKAAGDATIGDYGATPYAPLLEHKENKEFVQIWKQRSGHLPADNPSTAYDGGLIAIEALKATGGDTTPAKIRDAILKLDFMGAQGRIHFDPETKARIRDIYVCQLDKREGDFVWVPIDSYKDVPPNGFAPPPPPPAGH